MSERLLEYGHADGSRVFGIAMYSRAFRAVVILWLLPLVVGILTFGVWVIFRAEILEIVGFFTLIVGTVMAIVGGLTLIGFVTANLPLATHPAKEVLLPALMMLGLFASNFAAAAAVVHAVSWVRGF